MSGSRGDDVIVEVLHLHRRYALGRSLLARLRGLDASRTVRAVDDVSFRIPRGSTFAIVGESGCGKSTIARMLAGILAPTEGDVLVLGHSIRTGAPPRGHVQMIFQDPFSSLNPRWRVGRIIAEPIRTHRLLRSRRRIDDRVAELLETVGLAPEDMGRYPHQFSGGQRQRISIARALSSNPEFLICDEPTSALDVSVQAQVLNLMRRLQNERHLTYLLISHNLAVVAHMADVIAVMYLGRIVEQAPKETLLRAPQHPYTKLLFATAPDLADAARPREPVTGEVPSPIDPPSGCHFHPRCPLATELCRQTRPEVRSVGPGHTVACHAATGVSHSI